MWNSRSSNCKQEWGPWSRLGGETMQVCAGNCVQESKLCTAEITKMTDLSFQFVLMGFFFPEKKKSIEVSLLKFCMPNFSLGLIAWSEGSSSACPLIMEISICMTDPLMEEAERCMVSVQLLQLLQNQRVCIVWNRRIASKSRWHKALLCTATSEWVRNSLSSCSFLLRLVNSVSWQD